MTRKLYTLSDDRSLLRSALEKEFTFTPGVLTAPASRSSYLEQEHILFIDATALDEAEISNHDSVKAAISGGIPMVILRPTSGLLKSIIGFGTDNTKAALVVLGKRRTAYCKAYMDEKTLRAWSGMAWSSEPSENAGAKHDDAHAKNDRADAKDKKEPEEEKPLLPTGAVRTMIDEPDLPKTILEDLANGDQIEKTLTQLEDSPTHSNSVPDNRIWNVSFDMGIASYTLNDPSGESNRTQTARFQIAVELKLIAANTPHNKILHVIIKGAGFQPFLSGQSMIRDDVKHRGWAQSVTMVTVEPYHSVFGTIHDYLPKNEANVASVTIGFSSNIGFSGRSLTASFTSDNSRTISSVDFRTLTEWFNQRSLRFYQNAYIVGGDTQIDARYLGFTNLVSQDGWTHDKGRMFYEHITGTRVRSWPSLSMQLVNPGSECLYYASSGATESGILEIKAGQGMNYVYTKYHVLGIRKYVHHEWHEGSMMFFVDFNRVHYNDP